MTERTEAECQHCGGKLIVYATRHTETQKVQHRRCKLCRKAAESKRVSNGLAERVADLEKKVAKILEKGIDANQGCAILTPSQQPLTANAKGNER